MKQRINYRAVAGDAIQRMLDMEQYLNRSSIDPALRELIKIRASQINGCAYCLNMHSADAKKAGETEQRIICVSAWRECTFYAEAEKAALELTEHVTLLPSLRVPDALYARVRDHFDERQYVDLVLTINQINSWNRLSVAMGNVATESRERS